MTDGPSSAVTGANTPITPVMNAVTDDLRVKVAVETAVQLALAIAARLN